MTLLILFSCGEDKINLDLQTAESDLVVVEAVLTNQKLNHKIKLTHPYQTLNGTPQPITGAVVAVLEGDNQVYNAQELPPGSGEYFTEEMTAVFGRLYTLYIKYNGKEFFAQSSSVPVEPLQELQYNKVSDTQYTLQLNESGSDPYYIDHTVSWKNTPFCLSGEVCEGRLVYYDLKTIDVNSLFKPDKEAFLFPENSVVIRHKYSVDPGYLNFLRSVLSETEWRGGIFDVQRANASSNLSKGAIGYFAVTTIVSDTTIIVKKP